MYYTETEETNFYLFSSDEEVLIERFLAEKGHTFTTNTVCGSCCGMYADEYWVNGIGGDFPTEHKAELAQMMKEKGYTCSIGGYTISADPDDEDEFSIKN